MLNQKTDHLRKNFLRISTYFSVYGPGAAVSAFKGCPQFRKVFNRLWDLFLCQAFQMNAPLNTHVCVDNVYQTLCIKYKHK